MRVFTTESLQYFVNKIKSLILHNKTLTVTIPSTSWSSNAYTYSNAEIVTTGYMYVVSPTPATQSVYSGAGIKALDVTTTGQITFNADTAPTESVTVNILMVNIQ